MNSIKTRLPSSTAALFLLLMILASFAIAQDSPDDAPSTTAPDDLSDSFPDQSGESDVRKALRDKIWSFHGLTMSTAFLLLYPAGYIAIRSGFAPSRSFRGHLLLQLAGSAFLLCGLGFGLLLSKGISTTHQALGLVVALAVIVQSLVGHKHHQIFVQTKKRSRYSDIHIWLGRTVLVAGWINVLLGLNLAEAGVGLYIGFLIMLCVDVALLVMVLLKSKRMGASKQNEQSKDDQGLLENEEQSFALTGDEDDSDSEHGK